MKDTRRGGVKPLIYGYMRSPHTVADAEMARRLAAMTAYADQHGFEMGTVFHELVPGAQVAFAELASAMRASRARDVVVISLRELASGEALRESMVARLDLAAGVRGAVVHALDEVAGFEPGRTAAPPTNPAENTTENADESVNEADGSAR
jgi:hypothetical protein